MPGRAGRLGTNHRDGAEAAAGGVASAGSSGVGFGCFGQKKHPGDDWLDQLSHQ